MMSKWGCFLSVLLLISFLSAQEVKEKYIYVPYQTWHQVWKEQKKVKLSLEEYTKLKQNQESENFAQELVVKNATYHGKIKDETLIFDVRIEIESFVTHTTFLDFTFGKYGISNAKLNEEDAPLLVPTSIEIAQAEQNTDIFSDNQRAFQNKPNDFFETPQRQKFRLKIAKKGHHVFTMTCHRNLRVKRDTMTTDIELGNFPQQMFALEMDNNYIYETNPQYLTKDDNLILYPKLNESISLTLKPKEKKDEKSALLLATINTSHFVKIDSVKSRFVIDLDIQHQYLQTFSFVLPEKLDLIHISENRWDIAEKNNKRTLTIQLEKEIIGKHTISLHTETQLVQSDNFELPKVTAIGEKLFRQDGLIYIEKSADIKLELLATQATRQIDLYTASNNYSNRRSKGKRQGKIHSFGHTPFAIMTIWNDVYDIQLKKSDIPRIVESDTVAGLSIYPDGLELTTDVNFSVIEGDTKQLSIELPKNWTLTQVDILQAHRYGRFLQITSSYYVKENILYIPLERKLQKNQAVKISVTLQKWENNWLAKWENARYLNIPVVKPQNVKYLPSFMGIVAHQDYAIKPRELKALSSVDLKIIQSVGIDSKNLVQGYKIESLEAQGKLEMRQKESQISVVAAHYIAVQPERIKYATTLAYNVKNASVSSFRFAMPKDFEGMLDITDITSKSTNSSLIKEKRMSIDGERQIWQIDMQKRIIGSYSFYITHEVPISKADETYTFAPIYFYDVDYVNGYIGVQKTSRLDVEKSFKNLEEVATKEVPLFAHPKFVTTADFSFAAKYTKTNYSLSLRVGVHDKADVISAILDQVTIRSVFPGNQLERVECVYKLKHLGEQYFNIKLPEKANFWSAVVNGKGERPLRNKDVIAIPIPPNNGNTITIRIMYERTAPLLSAKGKLKLVRPETDDNIPVRSLRWEVHLPRTYELTSKIGKKRQWEIPWYVHGKRIFNEIYQNRPRLVSSRSYDSAPRRKYKQESPASNSNEDFKKSIQGYEQAQKLNTTEEKKPATQRLRQEMEYEKKKVEVERQKLSKQRQYKERVAKRRLLKNLKKKKRAYRKKSNKSVFKPKPSAPKQDLFRNDNRPMEKSTDKEDDGWGDAAEAIEEAGDEWGDPNTTEDYDDAGDDWGNAPEEVTENENNSAGGWNNDRFDGQNKGGGREKSQLGSSSKFSIEDQTKDQKVWTPKKGVKGPAGFFAKGKKSSSIETVKAKGLRSMDIDLRTQESNRNILQTSASVQSIDFTYAKMSTFRSLFFAISALSMFLCFLLLAQRKIPRMPLLLSALLVASFLPMWLGSWIMPFCNAAVLGLFLSILLYCFGRSLSMLGKLAKKLGGFTGIQSATLVLICGYLFIGNNVISAQEREIYIPYDPDKMQSWQTAKDMFLSYDEYQKLQEGDQKQNQHLQELPDFVLYNAQYQGKIEQQQVIFSARINIEVFRKSVIVPIGLKGTSIKEVILSNKSGEKTNASIEAHATGYRLSIHKAGIYSVQVKFIPNFEVAKKRGNFSFHIEPVTATRITFTLDKDMEADFKDFTGGWYENVDAEKKEITLFPQDQNFIQMLWYESSERHRAKGLNISATSNHFFSVHDNTLRMSSSILYNVTSGECERLELKIPQDYKIIHFSCTHLEKWTLIRNSDHNLVKIQLSDTKQRNLRVDMQIEKKYSTLEQEYTFPEIEPLGVNRENGNVTLTYEDPYKIQVTDASLVRKVRSNLYRGRFSEVFRYNQHPYSLKISILQQDYKNFSRSMISCGIEKNKIKVEANTSLEVKGKQVFRYTLLYPQEWDLTKVQEKKTYKGNVADWRTQKYDDSWTSLEIIFFRSIQKGKTANIYMQFEKKHQLDQVIHFPVIKGQNVTHESGSILFAATGDLELRSQEIKGMQQENTSRFSQVEPNMTKRLAYRYDGVNYSGKVYTDLRTPEVSLTNVINLLLEDDWVNFGYFIEFDIKYAGIDTFHFRVPKELGSYLDISGENIREKSIVVTEKYYSWTVSLHNKITGKYRLSLFPDILKNSGTGIVFYPILFQENIKQQTSIVIQNRSQYEITEQKMEGVTATNTKMAFLPPDTRPSDFIRAYKVNRPDWQLTFSENKQKIEHTVHASIDAIRIDTILQKTGECHHQAIFNLRHSGLQFLELEKSPKIKIWGAFIGNRFVRPSQKKEEQVLLIPLYNVGHKEQKIAIRIVYQQNFPAVTSGAEYSFTHPKVLNVSEINEVTWVFYGPKDFIYSYGGNVSKVSYSNFQVYSHHTVATNIISESDNRSNLERALASSNSLKKRHDKWVAKEQAKQNRIFADLQDIRQQRDIRINTSNIDKIQQYGRANLEAAQRVRRGSNRKVMQDQKGGSLAGKDQSSFVTTQNKVAINRMQQEQKKILQQLQTSFYFDLYIPNDMHSEVFAKKQGKASLVVHSYKRPQDTYLWTAIQFAGLLFLIILSSMAKIFSWKGYNFQRFFITIFVVLGTIFLCNFTSYIDRFYF